MKTYVGVVLPDAVRRVAVNGQELLPDKSLLIRNHSPDGFSWGYGGSGPAQLALAILLDYYGDVNKAQRLYQDFKWRVVAGWPIDGDWKITGEEIDHVCSMMRGIDYGNTTTN